MSLIRPCSDDDAYGRALSGAAMGYAALGVTLAIVPHHVQHDLGGDAVAAGLVVGAPALTGALMRPLGGTIADRREPTHVVATGALLMTLGALPAVPGSSLSLLVASRLLVGAGEGLMMSATVLWLLRLAGPDRAGRALGHIGLTNYAGLAVGGLLSTALSGPAHPVLIFTVAAALPLPTLVVALDARAPAVENDRPAVAASPRPSSRSRGGLGPGVGLLLVNVGYVAVLGFGAAAAADAGAAGGTLIVPVYGATIVLARTVGAAVPDQLGGRRTLLAAVPLEALALVAVALAPTAGALIAAVIVLAIGQAFAVPALGLLALEGVPVTEQGAAAGLFFAWFDGGVGLGGPAVGATAATFGARGGLCASAVVVAAAAPIAVRRGRQTTLAET